MKYTSLFQYLDEHLPLNATKDEIEACKRAYYKRYRREHRKQRVQNAKAISLTIPKEVWLQLNTQSKSLGINTYDYIKALLETTSTSELKMDCQYSTDLFICFELLKEYIEGDISIEKVYTYMEKLILRL